MENGYVKFANKNWSYRGDKGCWARVTDSKLTVTKALKGTISSAYSAEIEAFCANHGIDWRSIPCGGSVTVSL